MKPTWRKPVGTLALLTAVLVYTILLVALVEPISAWPVLAQTAIYAVLGTAWLLPLRRYLIWMETGRWR